MLLTEDEAICAHQLPFSRFAHDGRPVGEIGLPPYLNRSLGGASALFADRTHAIVLFKYAEVGRSSFGVIYRYDFATRGTTLLACVGEVGIAVADEHRVVWHERRNGPSARMPRLMTLTY